MTQIKRFAKMISNRVQSGKMNWYPGHMMAGLKAMIGKLNTVDCVVEVHDARIPFVGRNTEFRQQLGTIKPRILILNKSDLADLSRWDSIREKLHRNGDTNVMLTDLTGNELAKTCYSEILNNVVTTINESDRHNRIDMTCFKVMIVGIPNVGKSTLINRLRQRHTGMGGEAAKVGPTAGVTRHVDNMIRICYRPSIYSLDTPGVLQPGSTKNTYSAMALAACSTINDALVDPHKLASFILKYLNDHRNNSYQYLYEVDEPIHDITDLIEAISIKRAKDSGKECIPHDDTINLWRFIRDFRNGNFGKVMFE